MSSFYPGKRLSTKGERCTVRYVGEVKGKSGQWLGVEWDDPTRGKHSGTFDGVEYFTCRSSRPTAGSFLRPTTTWDQSRTFLEALRSKYAAVETSDGNTTGQNVIRISGKEAEEVGFEKIARQQAQLQNLRIVVLDDLLVRGYKSDDITHENGLDNIVETCPNITELDLGRNLFESLSEVSEICDRLPNLKTLKLDGNRLRDVLTHPTSRDHVSQITKVVSASFDHMLCTGKELESLLQHFPNIKELSASSNQLGSLHDCTFPDSLETITLEDNDFTSLEDIRQLGSSCPHLRALNLKNNQIQNIHRNSSGTTSILSDSLTDLDLSYNNLTTWTLINSVPILFPSLKNLRISHNPLFSTLQSADNKPLTSADGYMLTIARLPQLSTLNYSNITSKERLNSETYYLSQIGRELSLTPLEKEKDILKQHPRWKELCEEYGEPKVERKAKEDLDPDSLAARLLTCTLYTLSTTSTTTTPTLPTKSSPLNIEIPKTFSIYNILGIFGRRLNIEPRFLHLILETGEQDRVEKDTWKGVQEWDSEDEEVVEEEVWREREIELRPSTRPLGTYVEGREARIRFEVREGR